MTGLLEDILTDCDVRAIEAVQTSNVSGFDELVKISGLDPNIDFRYSDLRCLDMRGADLRGFDFTGSDLRQCIINGKTLIDVTTILKEAALDWIEVEALPIVQQMQDIEAASGSVQRQTLLAALIAEHGRTDHVITYLTKAAANSKELVQFLDFITQLPAHLSSQQLSVIRIQGQKLVSKKFKHAKGRTRRDGTALFAVAPVLERLKDSPGDLGRVLFGNLAEVMNTKAQTIVLGGMASLELADIEAAFSRLGRG